MEVRMWVYAITAYRSLDIWCRVGITSRKSTRQWDPTSGVGEYHWGASIFILTATADYCT